MRTIWLIALLLGLGFYQLQSQTYLDLILNPNETTTLTEIQNLAEEYFADRDKGRGSGYKQYKRWEYVMERMVNADGRILNFSKLNHDAIRSMYPDSRDSQWSAAWTALGPTSYTNLPGGYNGGLGRVNVIAFHPTQANTIYIGMPSGGVWKTTDGGTTWTPMSDMLASIGVSGIAVDHGSPNTVYILTGDGDGADTFSIGVLKSTDGGTTWNSTGLSWGVTNFVRGYKLLMHPTNANIMFATTNVGLIKTTDGWSTWSVVQAGNFRDVEFKPGSPATMYASTTNLFYRSTNTGTNWTLVSAGLPAGENRVALAVTPANSNYVYYLAGPGGAAGSGTFLGLYRSTDSGVTFTSMATMPNILGGNINGNDASDQSWYDLAIAADPVNANTIVTGGINVWTSVDGGGTYSLSAHWFEPSGTPYVHADIHDLVYNPLNNVLYTGTDGGIALSTNNGATWTQIWNGLQITQFYRIVGVEANQNLLIGGTQDNGSNKYVGTPIIQHIFGADGMDCMIDYNNNNTIYHSYQFGGLQRSFDGGNTNTLIQPGGSTGAWVTPYAMDASNPSIIYGGYTDVYRSTNQGTSWTNLGSDGTGALAVGVNNPARLYAASGSTLQTSSNTGSTWTTVTGPWGGLTVTQIALDPANASRVWVTLGGFTAGQKVYESTNAGSSWTNISAGLPNAPALSIAYENTGGSPMDAIYVGTSIGVYYRSDSTAWTIMGTGLPNVPVFDLHINHTNNKIRAGTYGRGLWETPLFGAPTCDIMANSVNVTSPSCPGGTDGTLTVNASCTTCSGITYTITPTNPAGPPVVQVGNNVFINLAANDYNVQVEDTGDASCNHLFGGNPQNLPDGTDAIAPAISCPPNPTVECGGDTSPNGTGFATTSDNCDPSPALTFSDSSAPNCGLTEVITRTWTSTDASGNSSTCVQTITVQDTTDPSVTCPMDINVSNDAGLCSAVVNFTVPTGTDTCGTVTVTQTGGLPSGSVFPVGNTVNNFDITDACGNTATCSFNVTVNDTEAPALSCPPDQTVTLASGQTMYSLPDYFNNGLVTATDNCDNPVPNTTQNPVAGTQLAVGTHTISFTATDNSTNQSNCSFDLTVDPPLGIGDFDRLNDIVLYPNPVKENLLLVNPHGLTMNSVKIFNIAGAKIGSFGPFSSAENELNVSQYAQGLYFLIIEVSSERRILRFVKE